MKVLVACEFSGRVRDAFIARGHDAMSCDLLPTESPGPHYEGKVEDLLHLPFDLLIAHPPCQYLARSGMHWTKRGLRPQSATEDALDFVRLLLNAPIPKICLENPIGVIGTRIRKATQIIQPYQFGENASKATCLWLVGLEPLKPTRYIPPIRRYGRDIWANQTFTGNCKVTPQAAEGQAKERSRTFASIALAMAEQWG